ncbi:hypothetical protein RW64_09405 [Geobacter sulfurreducens]|nr:hypothetical protein RW64_09405 [Geobacter sulfurreducens]
MAIISASRRTDIPAFFADWFMNRIREGYFHRVTPFNAKQVKAVSLAPQDVDVIVFWTKNPKPLLPHLDELDRLGFRYYFQFTLNPYDAIFEPHVPPLAERLETFRELSRRMDARRVIWRYDPIIISDATPVEYHLEKISTIAAALQGHTTRVVFSFLDFYGKVSGRIRELEKTKGIRVIDITDGSHREEMLQLAAQIKQVGNHFGMEVLSCAEQSDLAQFGIEHGSCIDGGLIRSLFGIRKNFPKDKNQRGACLCAESIDMGMYNTCSFQCTYCYANLSPKNIAANLAKCSVGSPSMVVSPHGPADAAERKELKTEDKQLDLAL